MNKPLLAVMFALAGCNQNLHAPKRLSIAPESVVYYERFLADAAAQGYSLQIDDLIIVLVDDLESWTPGTCTQGAGTPRIRLNRERWGWQTEATKEHVMYHELGHCVLQRDHVPTWVDGKPTSLMYEQIFDNALYLQHRRYYVQELFNLFAK